MTAAARNVLNDCNLAHEMLENENSSSRWRVLWSGGVALLRTVGHVLYKVDARDSNGQPNELHPLAKEAFCKWRSTEEESHRIFRDSIEQERNNILKEYHFSIHLEDTIQLMASMTSKTPELFEIDSDLYRPIVDGYGEGEDARDIFLQAIHWWESELSELEKKLRNT